MVSRLVKIMILVAVFGFFLFYSLAFAEVEIPDYETVTKASTVDKKEWSKTVESKPVEKMPAVTETATVKSEATSVSASAESAVSTPSQTPEKSSVSDIIISGTFKSLCKGFVAVADIKKLRKKYAAKIEGMSAEKYKKHFGRAYEVLKDMPFNLLKEYKVSENMSKEQVLKDMEIMSKDTMYKLINEIPDRIIAKHFRNYLRKTQQNLQSSNAVMQIKGFWNKWMEKIEK